MAGMIIVASCKGCNLIKKVSSLETCKTWAAPHAKQRLLGGCPSQTNKVREVKETKIINALKASKRAAKGA
jgi:hypothetical protein